jgi:Phosphotransferase enzyme family
VSVPLVTEPDELTAEWLSRALRAGGTLPPARSVVAVERSTVGTGQMGDAVRLVVTYDEPVEAPPSFVAKLPAADPTSRATGTQMRSYETEVRFYQELAPGLPIRTPRCHHAAVDEASGLFVLLLEDLAPARQGDQLAGCDLDQAAVAVREVAKLHGPRWGDPSLEQLPWLNRHDDGRADLLAEMVPGLYDGFVERYGDRLDDDVLAMGAAFVRSVRRWYGLRPRPWTVVHTDYRLDNLLFGTAEGGPPIAVVDWQTVGLGPGVSDVAYFLGAGLALGERRAHERELLREWHDGVVAFGVTGYDRDRCWEDYRRATLAGFHMAVLASMIVRRTERGDDMFVAMASRHGRHVLDLDGLALMV